MNKKTKNTLKGIVKECLIEILAEGLIGNNQATLRETRELRGTIQEAHDNIQTRNIESRNLSGVSHTVESKSPTKRSRSYLDSITTGIPKQKSSTPSSAVESNQFKNVTSDPVMQGIFADTAATTLREQKEGGRPSGPSVSSQGDHAAKVVDSSMPEDLFGESASKWASLAFAPTLRNK